MRLRPNDPDTMPPQPDARAYEAMRAAEMLLARDSLAGFIRAVAPWFTIEECHLAICMALEAVERGEIQHLMLHMPPRAGKSMITSVFFPAWYIGRRPHDKILAAGHSEELMDDHSSMMIDIIKSDTYRAIFPHVTLKKSRARQFTLHSDMAEGTPGSYFAASTNTGIAGKGLNLGIIDDPLSEQEFTSKTIKTRKWRWFTAGLETRVDPQRYAIIVMATRWCFDDIPGRLLARQKENPEAGNWTVLSIPAILDERAARLLNSVGKMDAIMQATDPRNLVVGGSFAPRRFTPAFLRRRHAQMPEADWSAQYMQRPANDNGALFQRNHFRKWTKKDPPNCIYMATFYDTAFEDKVSADYTARLTVGIFEHTYVYGGREFSQYTPILLEAHRERIKAANLLAAVKAHHKEWMPDRVVIEKRASGIQLVQELHKQHPPIVAEAWLPGNKRGLNDKVARANLSTLVLGVVPIFYIERQWAEDFIEEILQFPLGEHDDFVDTLTMAILWLRKRGFLQLPTDEMTEDEELEREIASQNAPARRLYG